MPRGKPWERPDDATLEQLASECGTQRELATTLGVPQPTVQNWLGDAEERLGRSIRPTARKREANDPVSREQVLDQEVRELRSALRKAQTADAKFERLVGMFAEAIQTTPPKLRPPKAPDPRGHTYTQVLLLSDTHAGEIVNPEAVGGANEYNWQIMEDRLARLSDSLLNHRDHHTGQVSELQLWVLGDMLSGNNHLELMVTNEIPIAEQCWQFGNLLADFISGLAAHYPKTKVYGVVGNHPRVTQKPANKQVFNNFDWLSYKVAELRLQGQVRCHFPRSGSQIVEVAGKNAYLFHGDGVRSSMPGVPWGGLMRRWNEIKKDHADRGVLLNYIACGHFHQLNAMLQHGLFMNGSVKGTDEYVSKQFGSGAPPAQLAIHFSNKHQRPTGAYPIDL